MIKSLIVGLSCLIIFTSFTNVVAQEEVSILLGKNMKEWHAISAALISEGRHEESIKYYDKILEINPNNVKALASKGIAFAHLQEYGDALIMIDKALLLDPSNEIVKGKKANFLSGVPTIPAHDSVYEIKFRITVRDSSGSLISVSESTNTRYLPYEITDEVFAKGFDMIDTVMIDGTLYEKVKKFENGMTIDDRTGMFSITTTLDGYLIDIFQAFTPMIIIEKDDVATIEWTILKKIT